NPICKCKYRVPLTVPQTTHSHCYSVQVAGTARSERARIARQGRRLEYFTIAWNVAEGIVALVSGAIAGSISLVGFGVDSAIEVASGSVLLWRMIVDADLESRESNEKLATQTVGLCFLALAAYVGYESVGDLVRRHAPERSIPGIVLACALLIVMPI